MSKVIVHRHAAKYLQRLPSKSKDRIKAILRQLAHKPLEHPDVIHTKLSLFDKERCLIRRSHIGIIHGHLSWPDQGSAATSGMVLNLRQDPGSKASGEIQLRFPHGNLEDFVSY